MFKHTIKAFFHSLDGLKATYKDEVAFRLLLMQSFIVILFIILFPMSYTQQAFLIISIAICLLTELLNSAIENVVDLATADWHIHAKKAKDMGSAAQFIATCSLYLQVFLVFFSSFIANK